MTIIIKSTDRQSNDKNIDLLNSKKKINELCVWLISTSYEYKYLMPVYIQYVVCPTIVNQL